MKTVFAGCALLLLSADPALAQKRVTCTGKLIDVDLSSRASFPLAVIYDASGNYTCVIDRSGAGHDPLRPCSAPDTCRVVGIARKIGNTYHIRELISVDAPE